MSETFDDMMDSTNEAGRKQNVFEFDCNTCGFTQLQNDEEPCTSCTSFNKYESEDKAK